MCDDCRVLALFVATDNPFAGGPRPKTRTPAPYLRVRAEINEARRKLGERGGNGSGGPGG